MEDFFVTMDYWYRRHPGLLLLEQEREILSALLSHKLGDVIIQCGGPSDLQLIADSPIPHQFYCALDTLRTYFSQDVIVADQTALPFTPGSIDVAVVAHLLSFLNQPLDFLQQLYDALTPDGQLYLLGFNSRSLWGAISLLSSDSSYPWCGRFYPLSRVVSWLRTCGFHVVIQKTLCFRPPFEDKHVWEKTLFLEALGQMCCPRLGGVYVILAQKYETTLTPVSEAWGASQSMLKTPCVQGQAIHIPHHHNDSRSSK
ncbi:MAG: hypothetical protein CL816_00335 [Coxiellaceae bacterium]|nr:hypothetical protein [Coxiellaceae bacterium]|tara:strand:- start:17123 stop:17893 length:771 start_codon:yes stop_codon:yes gene_type:complete